MKYKMGKIIRNKRNEYGFTLEYVSRQTDISKGYLCDVENGKLKNPSAINLLKICEILQLDMYDVLDDQLNKQEGEEG